MEEKNFTNEIEIINQIISLINKIDIESLKELRHKFEDQRSEYLNIRFVNDYATTYLTKNHILNLNENIVYQLLGLKNFCDIYKNEKTKNNLNSQILKSENYKILDI